MRTRADSEKMPTKVKETGHTILQILEDLIDMAIEQVESKLKELQKENINEEENVGLEDLSEIADTPSTLPRME